MWTGRVGVKSRFGRIGMRWNGLRRIHRVVKFRESSSNRERHCQSAPIKPQSFGISPAKELINISCFVCVAFRWVLHDLYTFAREEERNVPASQHQCREEWMQTWLISFPQKCSSFVQNGVRWVRKRRATEKEVRQFSKRQTMLENFQCAGLKGNQWYTQLLKGFHLSAEVITGNFLFLSLRAVVSFLCASFSSVAFCARARVDD